MDIICGKCGRHFIGNDSVEQAREHKCKVKNPPTILRAQHLPLEMLERGNKIDDSYTFETDILEPYNKGVAHSVFDPVTGYPKPFPRKRKSWWKRLLGW